MEGDETNSTCIEELSFEKFKMWSTNAIKVFLHVRGKQIEGSHDDLAARYFFI